MDTKTTHALCEEALRDPQRAITIKAIRAALQMRSGKAWSVTGGRGTAWGWIGIEAPPRRRAQYGYMSPEDQTLLGSLLGNEGPSHCQGEHIPAGDDYRRNYIERAMTGRSDIQPVCYWD